MNPKRTSYVHFRANDQERMALEIVANREGLTLSETARFLLRDALKRTGASSVLLAQRSDPAHSIQAAKE